MTMAGGTWTPTPLASLPPIEHMFQLLADNTTGQISARDLRDILDEVLSLMDAKTPTVTTSTVSRQVPVVAAGPAGAGTQQYPWAAGVTNHPGDVFLNIVDGTAWVYDGTNWQDLGGKGGIHYVPNHAALANVVAGPSDLAVLLDTGEIYRQGQVPVPSGTDVGGTGVWSIGAHQAGTILTGPGQIALASGAVFVSDTTPNGPGSLDLTRFTQGSSFWLVDDTDPLKWTKYEITGAVSANPFGLQNAHEAIAVPRGDGSHGGITGSAHAKIYYQYTEPTLGPGWEFVARTNYAVTVSTASNVNPTSTYPAKAFYGDIFINVPEQKLWIAGPTSETDPTLKWHVLSGGIKVTTFTGSGQVPTIGGGTFPVIPANPANPTTGDLSVNTADKVTWVFDGTDWRMVAAAEPNIAVSQAAGDTPATQPPAFTPRVGDIYINETDGAVWIWAHNPAGTGNDIWQPMTPAAGAVFISDTQGDVPANPGAGQQQYAFPPTHTLAEGDRFVNRVDHISWVYGPDPANPGQFIWVEIPTSTNAIATDTPNEVPFAPPPGSTQLTQYVFARPSRVGDLFINTADSKTWAYVDDPAGAGQIWAPLPKSAVTVSQTAGETPTQPGTTTMPSTPQPGDIFVNHADERAWLAVPDAAGTGIEWQELGAAEVDFTDIGEVLHIGANDPTNTNDGDLFIAVSKSSTVPAFDPTSAYVAGDLVMADDGAGNTVMFRSLTDHAASATTPDADATNWARVQVPQILASQEEPNVTNVSLAPGEDPTTYAFDPLYTAHDGDLFKNTADGTAWLYVAGAWEQVEASSANVFTSSVTGEDPTSLSAATVLRPGDHFVNVTDGMTWIAAIDPADPLDIVWLSVGGADRPQVTVSKTPGEDPSSPPKINLGVWSAVLSSNGIANPGEQGFSSGTGDFFVISDTDQAGNPIDAAAMGKIDVGWLMELDDAQGNDDMHFGPATGPAVHNPTAKEWRVPASPHHQPGGRTLTAGDPVTVDLIGLPIVGKRDDVFINTADKKSWIHDGTSWVELPSFARPKVETSTVAGLIPTDDVMLQLPNRGKPWGVFFGTEGGSGDFTVAVETPNNNGTDPSGTTSYTIYKLAHASLPAGFTHGMVSPVQKLFGSSLDPARDIPVDRWAVRVNPDHTADLVAHDGTAIRMSPGPGGPGVAPGTLPTWLVAHLQTFAPERDDVFVNTTDKTAFIYDGTAWIELPTGADPVIKTSATAGELPDAVAFKLPAVPKAGDVFVNSADGLTRVFDGTAWVETPGVPSGGKPGDILSRDTASKPVWIPPVTGAVLQGVIASNPTEPHEFSWATIGAELAATKHGSYFVIDDIEQPTAWDATATYAAGDVVRDDGTNWVASAATAAGEKPGDVAKWDPSPEAGKIPATAPTAVQGKEAAVGDWVVAVDSDNDGTSDTWHLVHHDLPSPLPATVGKHIGDVLTVTNPATGDVQWMSGRPTVSLAAGPNAMPAVAATDKQGDVFVNTHDKKTWLYDGTAWQLVSEPAPTPPAPAQEVVIVADDERACPAGFSYYVTLDTQYRQYIIEVSAHGQSFILPDSAARVTGGMNYNVILDDSGGYDVVKHAVVLTSGHLEEIFARAAATDLYGVTLTLNRMPASAPHRWVGNITGHDSTGKSLIGTIWIVEANGKLSWGSYNSENGHVSSIVKAYR